MHRTQQSQKKLAVAAAYAVYAATYAVMLTLLLASCASRVTHVTNLPPGVSEDSVKRWYSATGALKVIADTNKKAQEAVVQLNHTKVTMPDGTQSSILPDGPAYAALLTGLGKIARIQIEAAGSLGDVPKDFGADVRTKMNDYSQRISAELQTINASGVTGIKDPKSLAEINALISTLQQSVSLIISLSQAIHP